MMPEKSDADMTTENEQNMAITFSHPSFLSAGPVLALILSGAIAGWMSLGPAPEVGVEIPAASSQSERSVRTASSTAMPSHRTLSLYGETTPMRIGLITSAVPGTIDQIVARKGAVVSAGDEIVVLHSDDLGAREEEARMRLNGAREDMTTTKSLHDRGIATADRLRDARTTLAAAESSWAAIQTERTNQVLTAPFSGTIDTVDTVVGDRLPQGAQVASILDTSSLIVEGSVPQSDVSLLSIGGSARVILSTGEEVDGVVTFISQKATPETRAFPIEVEVPNPTLALRAGTSARIEIDGPDVLAHSVSTADLSLDASGDLSIKLVEQGRVRSYPIDVLTSRGERILITGLPREADIITTGQAFVRDGEQVLVSKGSDK